MLPSPKVTGDWSAAWWSATYWGRAHALPQYVADSSAKVPRIEGKRDVETRGVATFERVRTVRFMRWAGAGNGREVLGPTARGQKRRRKTSPRTEHPHRCAPDWGLAHTKATAAARGVSPCNRSRAAPELVLVAGTEWETFPSTFVVRWQDAGGALNQRRHGGILLHLVNQLLFDDFQLLRWDNGLEVSNGLGRAGP